jgi:hypothetical protein
MNVMKRKKVYQRFVLSYIVEYSCFVKRVLEFSDIEDHVWNS